MIRTLLFEEFVKKFLKALAFAAAAAILALGVKTVIWRWFAEDRQVKSAFDTTLVIIMLLIAALAGGSTLARAFREGPLRLLDVMPVPRPWIWLIRVFTSFAVGGVGILLLLMVQPTLISPGNSELLFIMTGFTLLLFSLSCLISSLIKAPTLVSTGLAGLFGLGILFVLVVAEDFLSYGGISGRGFVVGLVAGGFLPAVCLVFSLRVFTRGEMDVPRRQWRNVATGMMLLLGAIFFAVAAVDAGVFEMNSPWKTDEIRASHTGAYVAAIQFKGKYSPQFRAVVLETATGKVLKTYEGTGWVDEDWTPDDALLVITKSSTLRYLLHLGSETVTVSRIFPTEEQIFHKPQYRFTRAASDARGALLLIRDATFLASTSHSLLLRMDSSGRTRELLKTPGLWSNLPRLERAFDGSVLVMKDVLWQIRDDATPMPHTAGHFHFADAKEAKSATAWLENNRPPLRPGIPQGKYLRDDTGFDFGESSWLYYLRPDPASQTAQLLARRKMDPAWQDLASGIPLTEAELSALLSSRPGLFAGGFFRGVRAATHSGIIAALLPQHADPTHLVVFDMNSKQRYDLGDMSTTPGEGPLRVSLSRQLPSIITVYRNDKYFPGGFYFAPGKGPPIRLTQPTNPGGNIKFLEDGGHIYVTGDANAGFDIFYEKPGESPRLLLAGQAFQ